MRKAKGKAGARARMPTAREGASIKNSGYSEGGASRTSGILKAYLPVRSSAKADVDANLPLLRNRSADQATNTPVGAAAIQTSAIHTIGAGLRLFPRIRYGELGLSHDEARAWQKKVQGDPVDIARIEKWVRVKAFGDLSGMPNIVQICHDIRSEQYRAVPYLAPVIETLKQVSRYTNAELTAAIIKSFFALFFTNNPSGSSDMPAPSTYAVEADEEYDPKAPVVDVSEYGLGPGTLNALPAGVDVKAVDAGRSMSTFDAFVSQLIKQIGAAIGVPYEVIMKNFTSSCSASRAAMLQAWEEFRLRRTWFARDFCQPVYEAWLTEAIAIGRLDAPGFFDDPAIRAAWCHADWYGPTMSILDPVKDITGSALRVQYGLSTREREAAEMTGTDFEENLEQLAWEQKRLQELGLPRGNPEVLAGSLMGQNKGAWSEEGEKG